MSLDALTPAEQQLLLDDLDAQFLIDLDLMTLKSQADQREVGQRLGLYSKDARQS